MSQSVLTPLTKREEEVLELVISGLTNKQISDKLTITVGTVKTHVKSLLDKRCCANRTELAWAEIKTAKEEIRALKEEISRLTLQLK